MDDLTLKLGRVTSPVLRSNRAVERRRGLRPRPVTFGTSGRTLRDGPPSAHLATFGGHPSQGPDLTTIGFALMIESARLELLAQDHAASLCAGSLPKATGGAPLARETAARARCGRRSGTPPSCDRAACLPGMRPSSCGSTAQPRPPGPRLRRPSVIRRNNAASSSSSIISMAGWRARAR